MKLRTFQNLFTQMTHAVLASPLVLGASCGPVDTSSFDVPRCVGGYLSVEGLHPATPVDYIESFDFLSGPKHTIDSTGTICLTATNVPACTASVADPPIIPQGGIYPYLLTTKGDAVTLIVSRPELDQFLAPYDTEQEAAFAIGGYVSCAGGAVRQVSGGFEVATETHSINCRYTQHDFFVDPNGVVTEKSSYSGTDVGCFGRRPAGLLRHSRSSHSGAGPLARHFVASAHLEAASIRAFRTLHAELAAHGAPARLQRLAARSARDEIRHARINKRLAVRYGGRPRPPSVQGPAVRPIEELARENAVEGCVRETYGALVMMWQAHRAQDPAIARAMARIARDEVRHASLARQVAQWAEGRLSPAAQTRVAAARGAALSELRAELLIAPAPELVATAGMPSTHDALALLAQLEQGLHLKAT